MSEDAYKRRLRVRKRKITTTLEAQGYRVRTFDNGPFHLMACKGRSGRAIQIYFGRADEGVIGSISQEPVPFRCTREVWQISDKGRVTIFARIR
jgi:hypothetical protein